MLINAVVIVGMTDMKGFLLHLSISPLAFIAFCSMAIDVSVMPVLLWVSFYFFTNI